MFLAVPRIEGSTVDRPPPCAPRVRHPTWSASLRVFPRYLRGWSFLALLLAIEPGLTQPGAFQFVLDIETEPTQTLGFQFDNIPIHEAGKATVVGTGRQNVARLQGMDRTRPFDTTSDVVGHVVSIEVLFQFAVDPKLDRQLLRVGNFVLGNQIRSDRSKRIARLHLKEHVSRRRQAAGRSVD